MDFFRGLIEQILLDLASAQHKSNQFSAKLVPLYENPEEHNQPEALGFFPVPNAAISSTSFTLRFSIEELAELMTAEIPPTAAIQAAAQAIVQLLTDWYEKNATGERPSVRESATLEQAVANFLRVEWMDFESTNTNTDQINQICDKLYSFLASLSEHDNILSSEEIHQVLEQHLNTTVTHLSSHSVGQLSAVFEAKKIESLASEQLCSITVNCDMRNYEVGFIDKESKRPNSTRLLRRN